MTQIDPYLTFNGNCDEAFHFYKSLFGGEFAYIKRHSQLPEEYQVGGSYKNKILDIALPINDVCTLHGCDTNPALGKVLFGKNITLSVKAGSKEQADKVFNTLAIGGKVFMPMANTLGDVYSGMCEDRFGMNWMISFVTGNNNFKQL